MSTSWVAQRSGDDAPQNAIKGGQEADGQVFYVARATQSDGSVHPGKTGPSCGRGALVSFGNNEVYADSYEILVGDESTIRWDARTGALTDTNNLVEGGKDGNGNSLYVVQVDHEGGTFPGKVPANGIAYFGYGGAEQTSDNYRVLVNA